MTNASAVKLNYPNDIKLTGEGIEIIYTIDLAGQRKFYYNGVLFSDQEIQSATTPIGTLLTVPVPEPRLPGSDRRTLTLLLPDINVKEREQQFKTLAILTTYNTNMGRPDSVIGPLQTYQAVPLDGIARIIYTIQQGV